MNKTAQKALSCGNEAIKRNVSFSEEYATALIQENGGQYCVRKAGDDETVYYVEKIEKILDHPDGNRYKRFIVAEFTAKSLSNEYKLWKNGQQLFSYEYMARHKKL